MSKLYKSSLVWLRRDLRIYDNAALYHALESSEQVFPVFIFDSEILN
ncbi:MAG: deoxyribodipyrimidine photo-lyase, partial [Methylophilaceae bacterium]